MIEDEITSSGNSKCFKKTINLFPKIIEKLHVYVENYDEVEDDDL